MASVVLEGAWKIADDLGLPRWWLNEQASVYISGKDDPARGASSTIRVCG
jgi:hypothetical protein